MAKEETQAPALPAKNDSDNPALLQIMIAEYNVLQAGRSGTIYDAHGRVNLYIGSISSVVVALAFIGQVSEIGQAFFVFALVLLLPLMFMGLVTFMRLLNIGVADMIYTRGMYRIRHFYTEVQPEAERYFILGTHDDMAGIFEEYGDSHGSLPGWVYMMFSTSGMVGTMNSLLLGAFAAILMYVLFAAAPLICIVIGAVVFAIAVYLHLRYQDAHWKIRDKHLKVLFPTPQSKASELN
ncbi:MAG: hypothetical protein H7175_05430 [Burkholderiales bacterium]|nr:hypothetical protein [Anaerolineae bacterium]